MSFSNGLEMWSCGPESLWTETNSTRKKTHGCFCPWLFPALARRETTSLEEEEEASWTAQKEQVGRVKFKKSGLRHRAVQVQCWWYIWLPR